MTDDRKEKLATHDEDGPSVLYEIRAGKVWFSKEVQREHRKFKTSLWRYIRGSRLFAALTSPFIYACIIPFAMLDLFISVYQAVCFPVYGVPKVRRADYVILDRKKLRYLNILESLNCTYCSYGNGVLAYVVEVAARTEQHWCPIKHAQRIRSPHSRYSRFLPYGDASAYRKKIEVVRCDFDGLKPRK